MIADRVNSVESAGVPLGFLRASTNIVGSQAARLPEIEVSGMAATHSPVTSSTILRFAEATGQRELVVVEVERPAGH